MIPTLEEQLRASIDLVHQRKAAELYAAAKGAAQLLAMVVPTTGDITLGTQFAPGVVRAFAALVGQEASRTRLSTGTEIVFVLASIGGILVSLQGRIGPEDEPTKPGLRVVENG
jgi:hypothetical protein